MPHAIPSLSGREILLVEDDTDILMLFTNVLQQAGAAVTAVQDGTAARIHLGRAHFDLLLTDYQVPGLSGDLLCEVARQYGTPRVVLMSCSPHLPQVAQSCRPDAIFRKGESLGLLIELLTQLTTV